LGKLARGAVELLYQPVDVLEHRSDVLFVDVEHGRITETQRAVLDVAEIVVAGRAVWMVHLEVA
jgi:hypothetical protein